MLQGLLSSPNMEILAAATMDNNPLWSFVTHADANYQAAAMEAILSQASLGLMSTADYQTMAHYGLLNHPSIIDQLEGMDETQVNIPSRVNPSKSAATGSSLGLDRKPPNNNIYSKQSAKAHNMMPHGLSKAQAAICAKRRSWQEALSSPPQGANHCTVSDANIEDSSNENCSHVIYPVNDSEASNIASLAYPCTLVERHEGIDELPMDNMAVYMKPALGAIKEVEGSVHGWQQNLQILSKERQFSKSSNVDGESSIKDVKDVSHEHTTAIVDGPILRGINVSYPLISLYKEEAMHQYHQNEKDANINIVATQQPPYSSRKRPAAVAHLSSSSSSSYSKRAHLQNVKGMVSTATASATTMTTTTATTSTTTKSSKSSSRNPQGPALNTNGKPRAPQGSANDPQSVAARNRRERINARLKVLQELVPNGSKVDLVTMLEKAINYVKYLQLQLRVLSNDDLWQASQDNISEQGAAQARSEEGIMNMNENLNNNLACSDTSETHYSYMGDKLYQP